MPIELLEAARIDGASRLRAMVVIDMPLVLPGAISRFFFAFTLSWGEYMYALTFMSQKMAYTVPLGMVNEAQVGDLYYWGKLMAGAVLGSVPVVIIYSFLMDYYLAGMTAGAVKGSYQVFYASSLLETEQHLVVTEAEMPVIRSPDQVLIQVKTVGVCGSEVHACPVWYAALAERGYFDKVHLGTLRRLNSILQGHPDMRKTPGIDMTAGTMNRRS